MHSDDRNINVISINNFTLKLSPNVESVTRLMGRIEIVFNLCGQSCKIAFIEPLYGKSM